MIFHDWGLIKGQIPLRASLAGFFKKNSSSMGFLLSSLIFDLLLLLIIAYFAFRGTRKGTLSYFYSLLALLAAYPLACFLFPCLISFLPEEVAQKMQGDAIAFASFLLGLYFCLMALCWMLLILFNRFIEDFSDKMAGGILGFMKGIFIVAIVILLSMVFFPSRVVIFKGSYLTRATSFILGYISKPLPPPLKDKYVNARREVEERMGKKPPCLPR